MKSYKFAIVSMWPIYYHVPIYKSIHKNTDLDLTVLYCDTLGLRPYQEKDFNVQRSWNDVNLLDGYSYKFHKNLIHHNNDKGFFTLVNPTLIIEIFKKKYDVVMLQTYMSFTDWMVFLVAKIRGIKIIFRGEANLKKSDYESGLKQKIKKFVLTRWLKACDIVMYSCTGNKEYWKYYGVDVTKMFPIPCAVDNEYFRNEREKYLPLKNNIKNELGISEDDFVISFMARFVTLKNPLDLAKAANKIENSNITLLFIGDGPERKNLENYCRENYIKAIFVGFKNQTEISKYLTIADLFVLLSNYDPSPKAMNEAMNFELPIICTKVTGTAYDLVEDEKNGFLVDAGDIDTIAEKIDYLNKNRDIAKQMGKRSLEIINEWTFEKDAYYIQKAIEYVMKDNK